MPSQHETTAPTRQDRVRQGWVTLSAFLCVLGTLIGFGLIGSQVEDSLGGALTADATLIAPASSAFRIWSVIYTGMVVYVVWQWLPANATAREARSTGWLAGASLVLNGAWIWSTQWGSVWPGVVIIVALAVVLGLLMARLGRPVPGRTAALWAVHVPFGLYLGWVAVATCANITAALVASGVRPGPVVETVLAVVVLGVAAALGVVLATQFGGNLAVTAAMVWGLSWIAIGRTLAEPRSLATAVAALAAALIVLVATGIARRRPAAAVAEPVPSVSGSF